MKISKAILSLVLFLFITLDIFATAQIPDKIIYKGSTHKLHSNPMEEYFKRFPNKRPQGNLHFSALSRGYVATFEFVDNILVLRNIEIMVRGDVSKAPKGFSWKSLISNFQTPEKPLKINWLTGLLEIPRGKIVTYFHMGYESTYENYTLLEVSKGVLKRAKDFDNKAYSAFKRRQFESFKKTEDYKNLVVDLKTKQGLSNKSIESFLKRFIISYVSKISFE
ncbi:MAG: hypothetical protein HKN25_17935 [Pyrinomonadaceae bacterium]|nr:hypothetical protein [Pyrinomonadaceae bacterium]